MKSPPFRQVLAIETSCDDTSVAIVTHDGFVLSMCSAHQDLAHEPFGGVVPEIAGRNHTLHILPLIEACFKKVCLNLKKAGFKETGFHKKPFQGWSDIDGIVVTSRPGLLGSLIVGLITAKTLALTKERPFLGVNHLEGHLFAPFLRDKLHTPRYKLKYPFLALTVSGGHSQLYRVPEFGIYEILGQTVDDAAGEAFDKFAKMLGLGFPGGVKVDEWARKGHPKAFCFPRPMLKENNFQMSFSGLKAAAQRKILFMSPEAQRKQRSNLCASYQEAICDVLLGKLDRAVRTYNERQVIITGGVSANSRLRARSEEWAQKNGYHLMAPPLRYCTDNAAMIGYVGIQRLNRGEVSKQNHEASPRLQPEDLS